MVGTSAVALGEPIGAPESCRRWWSGFCNCARSTAGPGVSPVTERGLWAAARRGAAYDQDRRGGDSLIWRRFRWRGVTVRGCGRRFAAASGPGTGSWTCRTRWTRKASPGWRRCPTRGWQPTGIGSARSPLAVRSGLSEGYSGGGGRRCCRHHLAFANLLPPYRGCDASFDLMRRRPDAVNG